MREEIYRQCHPEGPPIPILVHPVEIPHALFEWEEIKNVVGGPCTVK